MYLCGRPIYVVIRSTQYASVALRIVSVRRTAVVLNKMLLGGAFMVKIIGSGLTKHFMAN